MANYYSPKEITSNFAASATHKKNLPIAQFILMSILGGVFIAFGGLLTVMVAGGMPEIAEANPGIIKFVAGALFPVGLLWFLSQEQTYSQVIVLLSATPYYNGKSI